MSASAEEQVTTALLAASAVTSKLGSNVSGAYLYSDEIPEKSEVAPGAGLIEFHRVPGSEIVTYADGSVGATRAPMLIICYAASRIEAMALRLAVQNAMTAALHVPADIDPQYIPELQEYAEAIGFDVWED